MFFFTHAFRINALKLGDLTYVKNRTKSCGNRLTELGDLAQEKKTSAVKHKTARSCRIGRHYKRKVLMNTRCVGRFLFDLVWHNYGLCRIISIMGKRCPMCYVWMSWRSNSTVVQKTAMPVAYYAPYRRSTRSCQLLRIYLNQTFRTRATIETNRYVWLYIVFADKNRLRSVVRR